jgi:CBS domain-containing protein
MNTLSQLLSGKGHEIWSIGPDDSVYDAIHLMAEKGIGALVVLDNETIVGIISERDYARQVILKDRSSKGTMVKDIMSADVICANPQQTIDECLALMTEKRFRHLPVMDGDKMVGLVSMGDLVKTIIAEQKETIDQLEHYITG